MTRRIETISPSGPPVWLTRFQVGLLEQLQTTCWTRTSELVGPCNAGHVGTALAALVRHGLARGEPAYQVAVQLEGPPGEMCWWRL